MGRGSTLIRAVMGSALITGSLLVVAGTPASADVVPGNGVTINAIENQSFTGTVATFTSGTAGPYVATIQWGDGTSSAVELLANSSGTYAVIGTHTYAEDGDYSLTTSIADMSDSTSEVVDSSAIVGEGAFSILSNPQISIGEGLTFSPLVATFSDPGSTDPASAYTATINWGDGTTSPGTITADGPGDYTVIGTHTYADEMSGLITVTVGEGEFTSHTYSVLDQVTVTDIDVLTADPSQPLLSSSGGGSVSGPLAVFDDTYFGAVPLGFNATIDWGDGTTSTGTVSGPVGGPFTVSGDHTYIEPGLHFVQTTLGDDDPGTATGTVTNEVFVPTVITTTSLSASTNPKVTGSGVTYTATVSPTDNGGSVAFYDDAALIESCGLQSLSGGVATCELPAGYATHGMHPITAVYSGDGIYAGSTSPVLDEVVIAAPGAPIDLKATPGDGQAVLSWSAPADNGGTPITGYNVYASGGSTPLNPSPLTNTNYTVTSLTDGTSSSFYVKAVNAAGSGLASTSVTVTPVAVPGPPSITFASAGNHNVTVAWTDPADSGGSPITGYVVTASAPGMSPVVVSLAPSAISETVLGLTNTVTYSVSVSAENAQGSGPASSAVSLTPAGAPDAPTGVLAFPGDGQATVSWTTPFDEGSAVSSYTIIPSPPCPSCTGLTTDGTTRTVVKGLADNTTYAFTVTATNDVGTSTPSLPSAPTTPQPATAQYWVATATGRVHPVGGAPFYGDLGNTVPNKPIVGIVAAPGGGGYWLIASDGGVFSFGSAHFLGSMGGKPLNEPVIAMAADPQGGYWQVASDGGIFAFGAPFFGSMGGKPLNSPIVAIVPTPDGGGYWEVASDGGMFAFGDARFFGSEGGKPLDSPIVGMAPTLDGGGYWLVAGDGGIFAFGDATFLGSEGGATLHSPVTGIIADPQGRGYWLSAQDGTLTAFGAAPPAPPPPPSITAAGVALSGIMP